MRFLLYVHCTLRNIPEDTQIESQDVTHELEEPSVRPHIQVWSKVDPTTNPPSA